MKNLFVAFLVLFTVTSCETYTASRYIVPAKHTNLLKEMNADVKVNISDFTQSDQVIVNRACRLAGPVRVTGGKKFADYLKDALVEELSSAEMYGNVSDIEISGKILNASFSSITPAKWIINADFYTNEDQKLVSINTEYSFGTSWTAMGACRNVAEAFPYAVEQHVNELITSSEFKELLIR